MSIYSRFINAFKACGNKFTCDNRGFTLIELMAVLVIVGVMMGAFFSGAAIYMKQKRIEDMQGRFDDIRVGLSNFIKDDPADNSDFVRYPCPAPLTAAPGMTGFGEELCPSNYASLSPGDDLGGVFVVQGADGGLVLIGAIPTNTLDISNDLMIDEYGNRLTYAVTLGLTGPNDDQLLLPNLDPPAVIREYKETDPVSGTVVTKTANTEFIIVSHGADGAGSYTAQGVPNGTACRTTTNPGDGDSLNCSWQTTFSATFRDEANNFASIFGDDAYDDMAVHSLGENDGWWQATGGAGSDIVNRNPANIGIGPNVTTPVQRLDIGGAIKVANSASDQCDADRVGSIRYNDGSKDVVECCNGFAWQDIAYGCASGDCTPDKTGQMRFNTETGVPEYCNGRLFVPTFGADCGEHYHGEIYDQPETETAECDGGLRGQMTRNRINKMLCNNSSTVLHEEGQWSDYDRSACAVFPVGQPFSVTCTSKHGRTQTISATGAGEAAVGTAPSGNGVWVVYENGPYLNCFTERDRYWNGSTGHLDFFNAEGCIKYANLTGIGRDLASCTFH